MTNMDFSTIINSTESSNGPLSTLPPFGLSSYIINFVLAGVCVIIVFCDIIAIRVLNRCKRIACTCLKLSISYLVSDIVGMVLFIMHQLIIFGFGLNTDLLFNSRIVTTALMYCISSASMAAIIVERWLSLKANLKYTLALKRVKIYLVIAVIWLAHVVITCCIVYVCFYFYCDLTLTNCDIYEVVKIPKYYFTTLMVLYDVIMVFANSIVYTIARRHAIQIDALKQTIFSDKMKYPDSVSERQYASIMVFVKIVISYLLLQIPITAVMFVSTNLPEIRDGTLMRVFRSLSYLCFLMNSFVNLYLYILKIPECRMAFYFMIGKFYKRYERRASMLRLEVYEIVVSSDRETTSRSSV